MFKKVTHADGIVSESELLFSTPFGYLFPDAARSAPCLLPQTDITLAGLRALGRAMADTGSVAAPQPQFDSAVPAGMTYLGQFIDHDITARTDRDSTVTSLGRGDPIVPQDPDFVAKNLRNGRRPQLDLDSVFGDGPGLVGTTESDGLYDANRKFTFFQAGGRIDLDRTKATALDGSVTLVATVGDQRNDENIVLSQLHSAFLRFYNTVFDAQTGSNEKRYVRARQLVRWAYQYIVVNEYLPSVCDRRIVDDTMANGPRFFGPTAGQGNIAMPLEFSVAGFRFAHSKIRPFYKLSATSGDIVLVDPASPPTGPALLGTNGNPNNFAPDGQLKQELVVEWSNFVGSSAQPSRKIDTKIAQGLFTLPFRPDDPVLTSLAQSNLFRGYSLSIPTGQAVGDAMGVAPLKPAELLGGEDVVIADAVKSAYFHHRSPLWYYVLREAAVQQNGERLGEIGSRLVCETLIGLLKSDPNSYLNNQHDPAVTAAGVAVAPGDPAVVADLAGLLKKAGFSLSAPMPVA